MAAQLLQAQLAAVRGDTAGAVAITDELGGQLRAWGPGTLVAMTDFVRATALLADARDDEAYEAMRAVEAIGHADEVAAIHQGTAPAYVDAALATGRIDAARAVLGDLEDLQARFGSPTLDATIVVCPPARRRRRQAEELFVAADTRPRGLALPAGPVAAGTRLVAAAPAARRRRRGRRCAPPATSATPSGPAPWADQARRELRAAGELEPPEGVLDSPTPSPPRSSRSPGWRPSGLTNREIGQRLHLSHRTVGSHLYHVFPKLGVTSRGELAGALDQLPHGAAAS